MQIEKTDLPGVLILTPQRFDDHRGHFSEVYNRSTLLDNGIDIEFVQDNQSVNRHRKIVRGLHYQAPPYAQDKLVRVVNGRIFDVAVDIRNGSPTFGKWTGVELSAENRKQLLIPKGFLHGFITLSPDTVVLYKCSEIYAPGHDGSVFFADPDIGIDWGIQAEDATLSEKDKKAQFLAEFDSPFAFES